MRKDRMIDNAEIGPQSPLSTTSDLVGYEPIKYLSQVEQNVEYLRNLLRQESKSYMPCMDYISRIIELSKSSSQMRDSVNESWRRKLCEWCFEVVDHFAFDREVVSIALDYLDRTVATTVGASDSPISKRQFQLVAVTSLYTAIKLHGETDDPDGHRHKLKIEAFVELSRGFFQIDTIESMERNLLDALDWRLNPPTPLQFVILMVRLIPPFQHSAHYPSHGRVSRGIYDVARYLTELSVCVSTFTFYTRNSVVAYASIVCAIDALEESLPLHPSIREKFLLNVAEATGLLPDSEEALQVQDMLVEICPSLMERDVSSIIMDPECGKSSPVCVSDDLTYADHMPSNPKRSRTSSPN